MPEINGGKSHEQKNVDWVQEFFAGLYQKLKIAQKLSAWQTGYHSANAMVPTGYIAYALYNLAIAATADQIHMDQLIVKILQLT